MKVYLTEYRKDNKLYGDSITAESWRKAELLAELRGLGEKIIGELQYEVEDGKITEY